MIIPPNIHDPLHLLNPVDSQEYEKQLSNAFKKKRQRKRNKSTSDYHIKTRKQSYKGSLTTSTPIKNKDKDDDSSDANLSKDENASDDAQSPVKRKKVEKDKESLQLDKIVSPVVPSAGWKKPGKSMHRLLSSVEDPMVRTLYYYFLYGILFKMYCRLFNLINLLSRILN